MQPRWTRVLLHDGKLNLAHRGLRTFIWLLGTIALKIGPGLCSASYSAVVGFGLFWGRIIILSFLSAVVQLRMGSYPPSTQCKINHFLLRVFSTLMPLHCQDHIGHFHLTILFNSCLPSSGNISGTHQGYAAMAWTELLLGVVGSLNMEIPPC
ncbi:hypothetical protein Tco_0303738 [Tanacetum coccineum]